MFFKRKKKTLVLYYSQSMGNTKKIAEKIAEAKSYDIEPILTIKKYTGSYDDIMAQGK
jgi:flavodoxin